MTIPAWPFRANWANPISETYEWKTSVLASRSGAEQRMAQRITPRRSVEYPVQLYSDERTLFDLWVMRNGGHPFYVPMPSETFPVAYSLSPGDNFLPFDTAFRDETLPVGGKLVLQDGSFNAEVVEIISNPTKLGVGVSALTKSYPNGLTAGPAFIGQITDTVTMARKSGAVYEGTVRFLALQSNPRVLPAVPPGYQYRGFTVLTTKPNSASDLEYTYERPLNTIDNGTSVPVYTDPRGYAATTQRHEFFLYGRQERRDFINLLYGLQGQLTPVWVPTFNDDLAPGAGWTDPDGYLGAVPYRDTAIEFRRDGTFTLRQAASGGVARPFLLPTDNPITMTSFLTLKRLGVDSVEITHYGNMPGVSVCSVLWRDAPDIRIPGSYYKNPFPLNPQHPDASVNPPLDLVEPITVQGETP